MTELDEIIRRQRGVVTRGQLLRLGMTADDLRGRIAAGEWRRLSAGSFATFAGDVPRAARRWAAVLDAGAGAMLSHRSAAEEAGFPAEAADAAIHVTVPANRRIAVASGVVLHRSRLASRRRDPARLPPQTRIEDTVIDLAGAADSAQRAMMWVTAACGRRLTTPDRIALALAERARVPRRGELVRMLDEVRSGPPGAGPDRRSGAPAP